MTAKIDERDGSIAKEPQDHCHPPEHDGYSVTFLEARRKCAETIQANQRANPSDVILEVRRLLPEEVSTQIVPVSNVCTLQRQAA